jgi:hypothetical protein
LLFPAPQWPSVGIACYLAYLDGLPPVCGVLVNLEFSLIMPDNLTDVLTPAKKDAVLELSGQGHFCQSYKLKDANHMRMIKTNSLDAVNHAAAMFKENNPDAALTVIPPTLENVTTVVIKFGNLASDSKLYSFKDAVTVINAINLYLTANS